MDNDELIDALAAEGGLLVAAVERGDPDAPVPTCPEWTLRELVRHVGGIHRWATRIVSERATGPIEESLETVAGGWPEDQDLAAWCRAGHLLLVDALHTAPVDLECWTFLRAPSPRAFWARRQLHETTIHRVDAEMVSGPASPVPPAQAADGIDELLTGFLPRRSSRLRPTSVRTIAVQPTDAGTAWLVTAGPDGATTERVAADADLVVSGTASDHFLLLWNRRDTVGVELTGDVTLLDLWRTNVQVVFR
ncbi:MAG: hypothetical protein QOI47_1439 [Actinomycetota bacterium]|nr:hypothetical protein [Actinomycetota bacterium]